MVQDSNRRPGEPIDAFTQEETQRIGSWISKFRHVPWLGGGGVVGVMVVSIYLTWSGLTVQPSGPVQPYV